MIAKTDKFLGKAYEALTNLSADEQKRLEYEAREKAIRDYNYQMKSNWNAGHEQGIKQGIKQGEQSGEARMARLASSYSSQSDWKNWNGRWRIRNIECCCLKNFIYRHGGIFAKAEMPADSWLLIFAVIRLARTQGCNIMSLFLTY